MMSGLYTLSTLKVPQLASVFEDEAKPFLTHLAMIMMLADYVKTNMEELVDTQANRAKLTLKKVSDNGFQSTHKKLIREQSTKPTLKHYKHSYMEAKMMKMQI